MVAKDLSLVDKPLGALFDLPRTAAEWARYRLSDEQVAFFHEHGYLKGIRILDDRQVEILRNELAGAGRSEASGARAVLRIPLERIDRSVAGALSCPRGVADHARLSRRALGAGVHDGRQPIARRGGAILARSAFLQAGQARRRGRLASGLFLLDSHAADGPSHLLDRPGRQHARQRLPASTCPAAIAGRSCRSPAWPATWRRSAPCSTTSNGGSSRIPARSSSRKGECSFHHPLMVHGSYRQPHRPPAASDRHQRHPRRREIRQRRAAPGRRAAACRQGNRWAGSSFRCYLIRRRLLEFERVRKPS